MTDKGGVLNEREWLSQCILHFTWPSEKPKSPIDVFQIQIGDITLDAEGAVFLGNVAYKRGDAIDYEFGGYHAYRDAGSSVLRIVDPLGYETRFKFKAFIWCDVVWSSSLWFRLLPRGAAVVHANDELYLR